MEARTYYEVTVPRRVIPQPHPKVYEHGDCGACVLGGLFGINDIKEVYSRFQRNGAIEPWCRITMADAFHSAQNRNIIDRFVDDMPTWAGWDVRNVWGNPSWYQCREWFNYIRMAIDAGYYGVASVNMDGNGPLELTDHVVLLCGVRERVDPHPTMTEAGVVIQEILVSCSAKHPEGKWYEVEGFLKHRGGFNCYLARPKQ